MNSRRPVNSDVIWLLILIGLAYYGRTVKVRDVLKLLRNDGWSIVATVGSHRQLKHATKSGRVTVSVIHLMISIIVYRSVAYRDQMLQLPFAQGINMAHNRIQDIVSKLK